MKILGINDSHDSGIALIEDGRIKFALNEERLIKMKLCYGFPRESIRRVMEEFKLSPQDIDYIAISSKYLEFRPTPIAMKDIFQMFHNKRNKGLMGKISPLFGSFFKTNLWIPIQKSIFKRIFKDRVHKIKKTLKEEYGFNCPTTFVDHHLCHAASAYYTSGIEDALVVTSDGAGDALSSTVSIGEKNKLRKIKDIGAYNSIAKFYGYVTTLCGYTAGKHEGKITGLAAHGKPIYLDVFKKMIIAKKGKFINLSKTRHQSSLRKISKAIGSFKKEDLASSIQAHLEQEFVKFIKYWSDKTKQRKLILAGGVFANVLLNQKIHNLDNIDFIYIHPHMGDGGLALGAALQIYNQKIGPLNEKLDTVYFGPSYTNEEIEEALQKNKIKYTKEKNIEKKIATLLSKSQVVARFDGRMEYGPRALGNRTILYQTTDVTVNDWLNKKLKRTEFMPFAPVTLKEDIDQCYNAKEGTEYASKFMTITFNCTDWMKKNCPGVVHIDGTARPQVISKEENPSYYKIVEEYKKITGIPVLINTSFNMHESPIVCTPQDAIDAFTNGHLNYLAIGDFLIKNEN